MRLSPVAARHGRFAASDPRIRSAQEVPPARDAGGWEAQARREAREAGGWSSSCPPCGPGEAPGRGGSPEGGPPPYEPIRLRISLHEEEPDSDFAEAAESPGPSPSRREAARSAEPEPGSLAHRLREMQAEARGEARPAEGAGRAGGPQAAGGVMAAAAPPDPRRWAAATWAQAAQPAPPQEREEEPSPFLRLLEGAFGSVLKLKEKLLTKLFSLFGGGGLLRRLAGAEEEGEGRSPERAAASGEGRSAGGRNGGGREEALAQARREAGTPLEATPTPHQLQT
ncbi:hypothetical protein [Neomegalonema sp.]|uniref:hypothetical protein n=1 Tax=Neomegalonema sp. TaxID=2039713 RepID=UPI002629D295|nr:hypothetical protein [Neomegalonema sp.]MDD2867172.1 hypothetical protein [Neomegalonema sp.]